MPAIGLRPLSVLPLIGLVVLAGCQRPARRDATPPGTRVPGLRAVTADAFGIHLRGDPDSGWLLWADGHFTQAATVHPGQTFLLRHPSGLRRWYRVVATGPDRLSLIEVEERPLPRGQVQSRRVIYVSPYDLDKPQASADHAGPP